jgi:hypothetical protein
MRDLKQLGIRGLILLEVRSKLDKVVRLDEKRWKHVLGHPEMVNQRSKMKETLVDPDEVRESVRSFQSGCSTGSTTRRR